MTMTETAKIIPFPLLRTATGRFIAHEYQRRPVRGRDNKNVYADGVVKLNAKRMRAMGISQRHIDREITRLKSMFARIDDCTGEKVRA